MNLEMCEPFDKIDDIKYMLREFMVIEHTNKEVDYDFLDDGEIEFEVINKKHNENLSIRVCSGEFMLAFSYYHNHYFSYECEYESLKKDIIGILNGDFSIANMFVNGKWMASYVLEEEVSFRNGLEYFVEKAKPLPDEFVERIYSNDTFIVVDNWVKSDCYEFSFPVTGKGFNFPRRGQCVRFIVKDGVDYGGGGIKLYNDATAYLHYVWVDDVEEKPLLEKEIIRLLEDDAKKLGAGRIFVNIDDEDYKLYKSLGYIEIPKIFNSRVIRFDGAIVTFDKTMLKLL